MAPFLSGPQLTICYLDMLMTSAERREQLRNQYCFDCDCARCLTQDKVRARWYPAILLGTVMSLIHT